MTKQKMRNGKSNQKKKKNDKCCDWQHLVKPSNANESEIFFSIPFIFSFFEMLLVIVICIWRVKNILKLNKNKTSNEILINVLQRARKNIYFRIKCKANHIAADGYIKKSVGTQTPICSSKSVLKCE